MSRCQTAMDKYTDPFTTPVNIDNCGGVMDMVSAPFTQEYDFLTITLTSSLL